MAYTLGPCLLVAVYADDIVLMSRSCYGLQKLVNICIEYANEWDIKFNREKSESDIWWFLPSGHNIKINGKLVNWVASINIFAQRTLRCCS